MGVHGPKWKKEIKRRNGWNGGGCVFSGLKRFVWGEGPIVNLIKNFLGFHSALGFAILASAAPLLSSLLRFSHLSQEKRWSFLQAPSCQSAIPSHFLSSHGGPQLWFEWYEFYPLFFRASQLRSLVWVLLAWMF